MSLPNKPLYPVKFAVTQRLINDDDDDDDDYDYDDDDDNDDDDENFHPGSLNHNTGIQANRYWSVVI